MATTAKKNSLGQTSTAVVPVPTPPSNPWVFNTGVPYIGSIDLENPFEIVIWGGVGASLLLAPGWWKLGIPIALLAVRYQMSKIAA